MAGSNRRAVSRYVMRPQFSIAPAEKSGMAYRSVGRRDKRLKKGRIGAMEEEERDTYSSEREEATSYGKLQLSIARSRTDVERDGPYLLWAGGMQCQRIAGSS